MYNHMPIYYTNEKATSFVCYSQWDLGAKYKVYSCHENQKPRFEISFDNLISAINYSNMIY